MALYLAAAGRCEQCGAELGPGWHADHTTPFARGGVTDVVNGQALCPKCNQTKGIRMLLNWQERFVRDYFEKLKPDYLLEATPGAGKTIAAAAAIRRALDGDLVERVIVVVPRIPLKRQAADEFPKFGVDLRPMWVPGDPWPPDANGIVTTYQTLASQPLALRAFTARERTLVVLDEVHHGGDEGTWGEAMRTAFGPARFRLLMSGTPFRTSGTAIPFVPYVDGQANPDFAYSYGDALKDEIVRVVQFPLRGGPMEWTVGDVHHHGRIEDEELSERDSRRALRTAIDPDGKWVQDALREADATLTGMRLTDPRAGANYQAATQHDARAVAAQLRRLVGDDTSVILALSDDDDATARIEAFRSGAARWLVSCDMVTEGIDIPRLRVLVYGKDATTALAFRQAVGRVVRRPDDHDHAIVLIPDLPALRGHARDIEEQILAWLDEEVEIATSTSEREQRDRVPFQPFSSGYEDHGTIGQEGEYTAEEWARADRIKLQDPRTASLNTELVIVLIRNGAFIADEPPTARPASEDPPYQQADRLRKLNGKVAKQVAYHCGLEHSYVNAQANRAVGISTIKGASIDQLKARLLFLNRWLTGGEEPARATG